MVSMQKCTAIKRNGTSSISITRANPVDPPPRVSMKRYTFHGLQIINSQYIEKIEPWFQGSLKVLLKGGYEIEISRRQAQKFRERLSL